MDDDDRSDSDDEQPAEWTPEHKAGVAGKLTGPFANYSGVTADGASHQILAASDARSYLFIQNCDDTNDVWIDFGTPAVADQPSIQLPAGGVLTFGDGNFMPNQALHLLALAGTHYTIKLA